MPRLREEPRGSQLLVRESLLACLLGERASRREPEAKLPARVLAQAAGCEVLLDRLPRLGPEHALVERRCLVEQRVEPLLALPLRVRLRRRVLVLERDREAVAEPLDRADEVEPFDLPHERDGVTADAAAEAVVGAAIRRDRERRRLLLVEGAQARVAAADLAQARARLDEVDDVRRGLDRFDGGVLDAGH